MDSFLSSLGPAEEAFAAGADGTLIHFSTIQSKVGKKAQARSAAQSGFGLP